MMLLRSPMIACAGVLSLAGRPVAAQTPAVPPPGAAITPATGGVLEPVEAAPVPQPADPAPPAETLPATPAPAPYGSAPAPVAPVAPAPPAQPGLDYGGETTMTPLPPPPPPLDPSTIRRGPWRGRGWLGLRMSVTGPVGGDLGARPGVLSLGGGVDVGWRINNVVGLGMGLSGQIHSRTRVREIAFDDFGSSGTTRFNNGLLYWDAAFARVFLPLQRRFQPYLEIGGGLARLNHRAPDISGAIGSARSYGAQMRAALGLEGWVSNTVTLGFAGTYRLNAFHDLAGHGEGWRVGHAMQGVLELGLHW